MSDLSVNIRESKVSITASENVELLSANNSAVHWGHIYCNLINHLVLLT